MINNPTQPENIVIIGGGIVGVTTAYFLSTHASRSQNTKITLIEGSRIAAGASGHSGGFLAKDWHGSATSSLAAMSYDLHKKLADQFDGSKKWGYRTVETLSVSTDLTHPSKTPSPIPWLPEGSVQTSRSLGTHQTTAQVHPAHFTNHFSTLFTAQPNTSILIGTVTSLDLANGTRPKSVKYIDRSDGSEKVVVADTVVLAAGPWSGQLALDLLGSKVGGKLGISGHRAHSIILKTREELTAHCLFTDMTLEDGSMGEPEVYARPDGTTYICGAGDDEPLPKTAEDVKPSPEAITKLHRQASALSPVFRKENGMEIKAEQACYLPMADRGRPLVGKVKGVEGVYIGGGLSCWGITQGPGTGLVLSELIMEGKVRSADISKLAP